MKYDYRVKIEDINDVQEAEAHILDRFDGYQISKLYSDGFKIIIEGNDDTAMFFEMDINDVLEPLNIDYTLTLIDR